MGTSTSSGVIIMSRNSYTRTLYAVRKLDNYPIKVKGRRKK